MSHRALLALPVLLLTACESGTSRLAEVTVPADVESSFTATAPGVVVADLGGTPMAYAALCGEKLEQPLLLSQDNGFGCLPKSGPMGEGSEETVRAWVQPMPAGWDAAKLCARAGKRREFYDPIVAQDLNGGSGVDVAASPEPGWPHASGTGKWKRDFSPCGGTLRVELTLAK